MYFVVFCHDWCATVPACWLNVKIHKVQWPPKTSNPTMESKKATNPKDNRVTIKYTRVVGPYNDYETARAVEIAAVDLSTNDDEPNITNQSDQLQQKRFRKKPAHLISSSDEEDADNELKSTTNTSKCQKVNNIENKDIYLGSDNNNNKDDELLEDTQPLDYGDVFADDQVQSVEKIVDLEKLKPTNKCEENLNSDSVCFQPCKDGKPIIPSIVKTTLKEKATAAAIKDSSSTCHTHCCLACRHNIERILHNLQALSMSLLDSNRLNEDPQNTNALPQFPIQNIEILKAFNKVLVDDAGARSQYKKMIQIRGGKDVKKHVRQILITTLRDDLAYKLSWTGQKKTIGVKDMKFVDVLIEAMIVSGACTIHEVQTTIQSWLQHAGDRVRYSEKKHNT